MKDQSPIPLSYNAPQLEQKIVPPEKEKLSEQDQFLESFRRARESQQVDPGREIKIDMDARRKWRGWFLYLSLFVLCTLGLVWLLVQFQVKRNLAIAVAAFMIAYMTLMGWWASRNMSKKSRDDQM